jgi:hypothetical protein
VWTVTADVTSGTGNTSFSVQATAVCAFAP